MGSTYGRRGVLCGTVMIVTLACGRSRPVAPERSEETAEQTAGQVDLRPFFAEAGLHVRAQGPRGTCSVFAVIGALEYALARHEGFGRRLSVEFLNWAANEATGEYEDGSFFSDLWTGFAAFGICDESDQPYRDEYDPDLRPSPEALERADERRKARLRVHWIKRWNVERGLTDEELAEIRSVLARGWPVCGGFRWPKKERWTETVLEMAPPAGVRDGHSVLLVGYRDDPLRPGGGVFRIHNSGKGLRDACMSYEYAQAYMNDAVWIDPRP